MEKHVNAPKLRFPEFTGEWEFKPLSEIAEKRIIKNHNKSIKTVLTNSAVYGVVSQRDFFDKDIANPNNIDGYYIVEKNDFVYNPRISVSAPVGPISRCHKDIGIMSPLYSVFRFNTGDVNFIEIFFNTSKWHLHMENIANYGARADRMSFSIGDFYKMPIQFPTLPEQTKIANFLTAVDEKLNQLKKKKDLLEKYKKGVMQKIFSQELRFKDDNGQDFPEWEEKKLGEMCSITIGEFVIKTKQNPNGKYPVYNGGKSLTGLYDDYNNDGNKIIISARGANAGFVNFAKERYWAGNSCYSIGLKNGNNNIHYFYFYVKMYENRFLENQQAANIPSVSKKDAENFIIYLPSFPEQTKIANFLSAIGDKINHCGKEIEGIEQWKKGLLQGMFV